MWVKFGYDPRLDPASKIYQSIDIRVPKETALVESGSSKTYSRKAGLSLNSTSGKNISDSKCTMCCTVIVVDDSVVAS